MPGRAGVVILVGTNYYLHLGKRSVDTPGRTNTHVFTWAVGRRSGWLEHFGRTVVIDEYGKEMSWAEFYEKISRDRSDESHIGEEFS